MNNDRRKYGIKYAKNDLSMLDGGGGRSEEGSTPCQAM
jgi:hypothetical protein